MKAAHDYCEALVRERDRERFLSALFAPADKRPHLFALYAFDLEVAHVPDAVREPMAGEIRLQWWREALAGERAEEAKANPVAAALLDTTRQHNLPVASLTVMIDARQFDLLGEPMASREVLTKYLDEIHGGVVALAARILDPKSRSDEAAKSAGRAVGLAHILRNLGRDTAHGRLFVPLDLLAFHQVHTASVLKGENSPGLLASLSELREEARKELAVLRALKVTSPILPAFLPATLAPLYLAQMEKPGYDPFRSDVGVSRLRSQFALWRAARSGKV